MYQYPRKRPRPCQTEAGLRRANLQQYYIRRYWILMLYFINHFDAMIIIQQYSLLPVVKMRVRLQLNQFSFHESLNHSNFLLHCVHLKSFTDDRLYSMDSISCCPYLKYFDEKHVTGLYLMEPHFAALWSFRAIQPALHWNKATYAQEHAAFSCYLP